ncbi:MAG: ABC transporter permease subunit [Thermoplasmata archaeon]|nr:ABC transporter permease subunit [Thermoplasmata archaeon]NIS14635.1 ABC transporter permease subunit [Thermoplasmata archaeon]NIS22451.1 ABC transporter permease subunit [Thermoplasmata archaeon]NIU51463.1 ABC transporter permease subunit [Thermoplasmata archaeon]NIV81177.1 ABC transporter permease subunit [Thermoplasmata archaeon]
MGSSGLSVGTLEDLRDTLEQNVLVTLFWHEVKQGFRSWLYRGWIILTFFFLFFFLLIDFTSGAEAGTGVVLLLYYFAFLGSLYSVVVGSAAITGEIDEIADSLLSKAVRRWEYIVSKYLSQVFLSLFVFTLIIGLASLILWAFDRVSDDLDWWNATTLVGMIALVVVFFTSAGLLFSTLASRTVFAFLMGMGVWFVLIFLFAVNPQWDFMYSPIHILNNWDLIMEGAWDIDWWKLVSFYVATPLVCVGVSLLAFYQRDL